MLTKKRRIHKFFSFGYDIMDKDNDDKEIIIDLKQYPDSRKFFLANYKPTKNELIENIADIYNTMEEQVESNNSTHYQFSCDH